MASTSINPYHENEQSLLHRWHTILSKSGPVDLTQTELPSPDLPSNRAALKKEITKLSSLLGEISEDENKIFLRKHKHIPDTSFKNVQMYLLFYFLTF